MRNNVLGGGDTALRAADSSFVSRFGGTLKGKKARAALALAVSLWTATGGVASAESTTETLANGVSITHDGTSLAAIDLTNWRSTGMATRSVSLGDTYTSGLSDGSITGAILDTSGVGPGDSAFILTTNIGGFFTDSQIAEAIRYKEGQSATYSANGVTLTGTEARGVVVSGNKKSIIYQRGTFAVAKLSFGAMTWGTACSPGPGYNFTPETTVDDSGLSFTNPADVTGTTTLYLDAPVLFGGSLMDIPETTKIFPIRIAPCPA